jgi:capsular exopolysaccharide synthesis family protein
MSQNTDQFEGRETPDNPTEPRHSPAHYSGRAPYPSGPGYYGRAPYPSGPGYYGPSPYGAYGQYGYGAPNYGGGQAVANEAEASIIGDVTIQRMLRVCTQRWVTVLVFVILGAIGAFFVFKIMPTIYEATSMLEMSIRPSRILATKSAIVETDTTGTMEEVFNTRLARLRSRAMLEQVLARYHIDHPNSTVSEEELIAILSGDTRITLQRRSRLVAVSVRSINAQLAADMANAYALTAETFTQDENKSVSEEAVAWLRSTVEVQRRKLSQADQAILDFKVSTQVDSFEQEKEGVSLALARVNADITDLESRITMAEEMLLTLQRIQNEPDRFGSLPDSTPRAAEIAQTYQKWQDQIAERNAMLARYTAKHPDVLIKDKEVAVYQVQFADTVKRACDTAEANLSLLKSQMEPFKVRRTELSKVYSDKQTKIDEAVLRLHQLQRDLDVNEQSYQALLNRMEEARLAQDENMCTVKVGETSMIPRNPVSPQAMLIFPAGPILGLLIGFLFILVIDHLEDKITDIADIEQRLRMKVLCVLPHVQKKNREDLALITAEDKFSHFSESFASLRSLLDSPRYREHAKVVLLLSTQPSEGKTISSSNLALSYATSGQRTLLVDFDMRRPRQARIYNMSRDAFVSLPHTLDKNDPALFEKLPVPSGFANLDLVLSRASSEISPANLMGSGIVAQFMEWARQHYDRIIIDAPPFGIVGDAVVLASVADSVILICCPDRTHYGPIKHAIRHLTEVGARVIGVLVNDVDFSRRSMFSGYDYHYRYSYSYGGKYAYRGAPDVCPEIRVEEPTKPNTGVAEDSTPAKAKNTPPSVVVVAEED